MISTLVVKGSSHQAIQAAYERRIPFIFGHETKQGETVGTSTASNQALGDWFMEDALTEPPFPVGSLLFWQQLTGE